MIMYDHFLKIGEIKFSLIIIFLSN